MPITRKPKPTNGQPSGSLVRHLVGKGGSSARPLSADMMSGGANKPVVVRIPEGQILQIEALVERRPVRTPRHRWLLEAIHEKIMRERKQYEC